MTSIWELSKEQQETMKNAGVDYSLSGCLEYNSQPFELTDIEKVLSVWEGENDGDDWRWILKLTKKASEKFEGNRFVFLQGGCDYTGWDCQSWGKSEFAKTALKAAEISNTAPKNATYQEAVIGMGMGRMISALSGEYMNNTNQVYDSLISQLKKSKKKTWRELKDDEFKNDLPKI